MTDLPRLTIRKDSLFAIRVDDQPTFHVEIESIIPRGNGYYEILGRGIGDGEYVSIVVNRSKSS